MDRGDEARLLHVWRHPKPIGAAGRCIGRTDLAVDPRQAKRLAHRIRRFARLQGLPREVCTSPLQRSAEVGCWLARWGWRHHIDAALTEIDFGAWDGLSWDAIGEPAVTAWCADFAHFSAHGGEPLAALFKRCAAWFDATQASSTRCVVGHAGWINAARVWSEGRSVPGDARDWPMAIGYGQRVSLHDIPDR